MKNETVEREGTNYNLESEIRSNVIYIVLDDVGFSDLGCYGSEIKTPHMDQMAASGLRYNNFNVSPMCSPTRASLLTGRNAHSLGVGLISNFDLGPEVPSTRGRITPAAATIAEILKDNGYSTLAVGKWHLTPFHELTPAGPFHNWPLQKGFERFYGFMEAATDQYSPTLVYDNHLINSPNKHDYHLSEDLVDHSIQFLKDHVSVYPVKPFFLQLAFGAQHAPHQVHMEYIDKYKGIYDKGWDQIRSDRFEKQKQLGIIPANTELTPRNEGVEAWDNLNENQKLVYTRFQETYAGFLTHTDEQIGRLVEFLKSIDKLDDTLIVLVSDNGASPEGGVNGFVNRTTFRNLIEESVENLVNRIDDMGGPNADNLYPIGWAQVSNTPFKFYKQNTYNGGVRVPFIINWNSGIKDRGTIRSQFHHAIDVTPTILDILKIEVPDFYRGVSQMPMHGNSMAYTFDNAEVSTKRITQYFSLLGDRAIWHDGWKAVTRHKNGQPFEQDRWELFNVSDDFSEINDLSDVYPEILQTLQGLWEEEAKKFCALPLMDISILIKYGQSKSEDRKTFTFYQGMGHLSGGVVPSILNRSYTIDIPIDRVDQNTEGVLVCQGNHNSGYTLYIKNNRLVYEYNYIGTIYTVQAEIEVPLGRSTVRFEFQKTGSCKGIGLLYIDNKKVGEVHIPKTLPHFLSHEGLDIGRNRYSLASENYRDKGEFPFTGRIEKVIFNLKDDIENYRLEQLIEPSEVTAE